MPFAGKVVTMLPDLPNPDSGAWIVLALKALAAVGFMAITDLVVLYAC